MDPDGIIPDPNADDRAKRQAARDARRARKQLRWRIRDRFRAIFGLRRVPRVPSFHYLTEEERRALPPDDVTGPQEGRRYVATALVFAVLSLAAVWACGAFMRGPSLEDAAERAELVMGLATALDEGHLAQAKELWQRAGQGGRDDPFLSFLDGNLVAAEGGKAAEETKVRSTSAEQSRLSVRDVLVLAGYRAATKDADGAVRLLKLAAEKRRRDPEVHLLLASGLMACRDFKEALKAATEYEGMGGQPAMAASIRGRAYLALGEAGLARREFETVLAYPGGAKRDRLGLANALTGLGDYQGALKHINLALREGHPDGESYAALGVALDKSGRYEDAEQAYRRCLAAAPGSVNALNNLAYLLAETRHKPAEGLPYAESARKLSPQTPAVLDTLGRCYSLLGREREAVGLLRQAAAGAPGDNEIQLHLAEALIGAGDSSGARPILEKLSAPQVTAEIREKARERLQRMGG